MKLDKKREEAIRNQNIFSKKTKIYFLIFLVIIAGISYYFYWSSQQPGQFDDFAKCLTEKGAVMYGAIEWCKYTKEQVAMFGNSFKYINYKDYKEIEGIKLTPTWVVNNERYERVQSFEKLSALTGCTI